MPRKYQVTKARPGSGTPYLTPTDDAQAPLGRQRPAQTQLDVRLGGSVYHILQIFRDASPVRLRKRLPGATKPNW